MKTLILAGGLGTRMGEETAQIPKPMVRIGSFPILLHVMDVYNAQGFDDFVILAGHRKEKILDFFANFHLQSSRVDFDLGTGKVSVSGRTRGYKVTVLDTGPLTMTGGRILRAIRELDLQEKFFWTYGDGLGNVSLEKLNQVHTQGEFEMTISGVRPEGRFGALKVGQGNVVKEFLEKPNNESQWINAGYGIAEPTIVEYLAGDEFPLEGEAMEKLAKEGKLGVNFHSGFWRPMDTPKDKSVLEDLSRLQTAPWLEGLRS